MSPGDKVSNAWMRGRGTSDPDSSLSKCRTLVHRAPLTRPSKANPWTATPIPAVEDDAESMGSLNPSSADGGLLVDAGEVDNRRSVGVVRKLGEPEGFTALEDALVKAVDMILENQSKSIPKTTRIDPLLRGSSWTGTWWFLEGNAKEKSYCGLGGDFSLRCAKTTVV